MRGIDFSLYHASYRDLRIKSKQSVLFIIIFTFFQSCGCGGIHIYCGNLLKRSPLYICEKHSNNDRQMLDHIGKYSLHLLIIKISNTLTGFRKLQYSFLLTFTESIKRSSTYTGSDDDFSDEDGSFSNTGPSTFISRGNVMRKTPASILSNSISSR